MKSSSATHSTTLKAAIRTAAKSARLKAFRKGLPVAISRNGKVFFVYKGNKEIAAPSTTGKKTGK